MKTIAFDFDGTLVDSMGQLRELAVKTVIDRASAYPMAPTKEEIVHRYDQTTGEPFRVQIETILPFTDGFHELHWQHIDAEYEHAKRELTLKSPVFHEVPRSIANLYCAGYRLWVVTSTVTDLIVTKLDQVDLWRYFDGCLGPTYGSKARKLEMIKADVFIGDTDRDAHHARGQSRFMGVRRDPNILSASNATATDLRPIVKTLLEEAVK